jgi:hypothetical protein
LKETRVCTGDGRPLGLRDNAADSTGELEGSCREEEKNVSSKSRDEGLDEKRRTESLLSMLFFQGDRADDSDSSVSGQRVLKESRQLRLAIRDMDVAASRRIGSCESRDNLAEDEQAEKIDAKRKLRLEAFKISKEKELTIY